MGEPTDLDVRDEPQADGTRLVAISGRVDTEAALRAESSLEEIAAAAGSGDVVVDVSGVRFLDLAGLRMLTRLRRRVAMRRGHLALVCAEPKVRRLLVLSGIDRLVPIFRGREEALAHAGARGGAGPAV